MLVHHRMTNPKQNQLLRSLSPDIWQGLAPYLELAHLKPGSVLYECGEKLSHAYFPTTAIVSLLNRLENGNSTEIAMVGNDGMLDVALITGGETMRNRAVVRSEGYAYRFDAQVLKHEFNRSSIFQRQLLCYTQSLITQMSLTAACIRHHSSEQRLSRWILETLDRLPSNELLITQELIAIVQGIRRETVTVAAGKLQRRGFIHCNRGRLRVVNRSGLEQVACECYRAIKQECGRLLDCRVAS